MPAPDSLALLTDALARGRLTLAEIGGFAPAELCALYALGTERLEAGHLDEAADILAGITTLFPYDARFWRALGITLHHKLALAQARAAYDAALLLEPGHRPTLAYRGEVLVYLGEKDAARADLEAARGAVVADTVSRRAEHLLSLLASLDNWKPEASPVPAPLQLSAPLALSETETLPLANSLFAELEKREAARPREVTEVTRTARVFVAHDEQAGVDDTPPPAGEVTATAVLPRRNPRRSFDTRSAAEVTHTAIVRRRRQLPLVTAGEED